MTLRDDIVHVLFDLDGTLIDSEAAIVGAYRYAFETVLGIRYPRTDREITEIMAARLSETCARVAGERAAECVEAYETYYREHADGQVVIMAHGREVLDELRARGYGLGVVTNKGRPRTMLDFERVGIEPDVFDVLVTAEDSVERKPDPTPILIGLRRAGWPARRAAYVGDGPQDVRAATAAGVCAVAAAYGVYPREDLLATGPDAVIGAPDELLDLLPGRTVR